MARGNQREKAREKNMKDAAGQKKGNNMTGPQYQQQKEDVAKIMREKQQKADEKKQAEAKAAGKK